MGLTKGWASDYTAGFEAARCALPNFTTAITGALKRPCVE